VLKTYPNLKGISSFGAGVEHILADPDLPPAVPVVRIVDERLTIGITEYVLLHVLRHHRQLDALQAAQRERRWERLPPPDTRGTTIGILGLGQIGSHCAEALLGLGFNVAGWSRTPKRLPGVRSFHGPDQLHPFLGLCNYLVCLLPLTPATRGILNRETLSALPRGAVLINVGRGPELVEEDLLTVLESGHLAAATLDVFVREPLAPEHPFWTHPKITVTPHNASDSIPEHVAPQIVDNIRRARAGLPLLNVVDRRTGY
jgi:glyoxylate/hydroxypyruvate reductase A